MTQHLTAEAIKAAGSLLPDSDRPVLHSIRINQTHEVSIELTVPDSLSVLEGHFPDTPVLPGILQIDWACKLAPHFFHGLGDFRQMSQVKFKTMILPGEKLVLILTFNENKSTVRFQYSNQEQDFSTGVLAFLPC